MEDKNLFKFWNIVTVIYNLSMKNHKNLLWINYRILYDLRINMVGSNQFIRSDELKRTTFVINSMGKFRIQSFIFMGIICTKTFYHQGMTKVRSIRYIGVFISSILNILIVFNVFPFSWIINKNSFFFDI
jgi:hypothetical protein